MKVGLVALHYPRPEHWDEMICRVHRAAEIMAAAPGCLAVDCWVSDDHQTIVTTGQWVSEQALRAGLRPCGRPALTSITTSASPGPARSLYWPPHERLPEKTAASVRRSPDRSTQPPSPPG